MASSYPAGLVAFKLACQLSPIILTQGIATGFPFNMLPIFLLTQAGGFLSGPLGGFSSVVGTAVAAAGALTSLFGGSNPSDLDSYFANFQPLSGATLIDNQYGTYPLGSQQTAANAVIVQPLRVSLSMLIPVQEPLGYATKSLTMYSLQATISSHVAQGGTFIIVTPSYIYTNCLLLSLRDISGGATKQSQYEWAWDFFKPLLTSNQIAQSQSSLMQQITNAATGSANPAFSGLASSSPQSGASPLTGVGTGTTFGQATPSGS
jgi:hypothetical protein